MPKAKPKLKGRAGSLNRIVLLRGLRARRANAMRRWEHKLCNDTGWIYWGSRIVLLDELIAHYVQENDKVSDPATPR